MCPDCPGAERLFALLSSISTMSALTDGIARVGRDGGSSAKFISTIGGSLVKKRWDNMSAISSWV